MILNDENKLKVQLQLTFNTYARFINSLEDLETAFLQPKVINPEYEEGFHNNPNLCFQQARFQYLALLQSIKTSSVPKKYFSYITYDVIEWFSGRMNDNWNEIDEFLLPVIYITLLNEIDGDNLIQESVYNNSIVSYNSIIEAINSISHCYNKVEEEIIVNYHSIDFKVKFKRNRRGEPTQALERFMRWSYNDFHKRIFYEKIIPFIEKQGCIDLEIARVKELFENAIVLFKENNR